MLSGRQFREFTENVKVGGDTIHVQTGERPTTGFMVSVPGREQRHPLSTYDLPDTTRYAAHHMRELSDPDQYMGGWAWRDEAYLDVSRRYPTAEEAVVKGWQGNQIAAYDLERGEDVEVPQSPRDLPIWSDYRRLPR